MRCLWCQIVIPDERIKMSKGAAVKFCSRKCRSAKNNHASLERGRNKCATSPGSVSGTNGSLPGEVGPDNPRP